MFDPFFPLMLVAAALAFVGLLWFQKRLKAASLPGTATISTIAGLWMLFAGGCAYLAWPLLFLGPDDPRTSMYVQVPIGPTSGSFNEKLSSMLEGEGFHPNSTSISSPDDPENPMYIVEARGVFTRVWSQNQLLSREEAFACGYRPSEEDLIVNDERQYRIAVTSIPFFRARAQATFAALKAELLRNGYGMSAKPLPCQRPA